MEISISDIPDGTKWEDLPEDTVIIINDEWPSLLDDYEKDEDA